MSRAPAEATPRTPTGARPAIDELVTPSFVTRRRLEAEWELRVDTDGTRHVVVLSCVLCDGGRTCYQGPPSFTATVSRYKRTGDPENDERPVLFTTSTFVSERVVNPTKEAQVAFFERALERLRELADGEEIRAIFDPDRALTDIPGYRGHV